eukprot:3690819-Amphidinium_carterae.1
MHSAGWVSTQSGCRSVQDYSASHTHYSKRHGHSSSVIRPSTTSEILQELKSNRGCSLVLPDATRGSCLAAQQTIPMLGQRCNTWTEQCSGLKSLAYRPLHSPSNAKHPPLRIARLALKLGNCKSNNSSNTVKVNACLVYWADWFVDESMRLVVVALAMPALLPLLLKKVRHVKK